MIRLDPKFLTQPIAHRALHDITDGRPENSRAAIRAAIHAGYGIEIDLQLSRDGKAMVFHDYSLTRLTGVHGPFAQRDSAELQKMPLLGGDEGIPTLVDILALVNGQVPILIEIKDQDGQMGPNIGPLEKVTAAALAGYAGAVAVMSFNPHSMAAMAGFAPNIPRGLVTSGYEPADWVPLPAAICDQLRDIPDYDRVGASFISHELVDLERPRVAELARQGADILCWTVRSEDQEADARKVAANITFESYCPRLPA